MGDRTLPTGTLTFFFSDIEGSTKLVQRLGSAFTPVLEQHDRILRAAFTPKGGVEVRTVGDAFFVVFPTADAAVQAAVEAQRALAQAKWPEGVELKVRIGLHTGVAELGGGDYVGIDVHLAARIAGAAHGGQIVASNATKEQLRDAAMRDARIELRSLGEHRLKDVGTLALWQVSAPGLPSEFPPLASLDPITNLPADPTPFVGRDREVAEILALVRDKRLVTLTGPGGTGKTRLSLRVAADLAPEFREVDFIALATIFDPVLVPATIAAALGVAEVPGRPITDLVKERLRENSTLLVLDNFEQIVSASPVVGELLSAAPKLRCLASSREVLRVYGEQEYPVPALSADDAVTLFVQRAQAVKPAFALTPQNEAAVRAICDRLDRLPLAIELAAARSKLFTPEQLLARLGQSLAFLTTGARDLPERQRTLRGAIAWSYDLLSEPERALFRRLGVFVGGIAIDAIAPVCDPDGALGLDPIEGAATFVDKSLLGNDERSPEPRFTMLATIREFAVEQLEASGEGAAVRDRHAAFFRALAERLEPELLGAAPEEPLATLEREHDNIRAALGWSCESGDIGTGIRIAAAIWRFWQQRSHLREGRAWLERLLAHETSPALRARGLTALGGIAYCVRGEPPDLRVPGRRARRRRRPVRPELLGHPRGRTRGRTRPARAQPRPLPPARRPHRHDDREARARRHAREAARLGAGSVAPGGGRRELPRDREPLPHRRRPHPARADLHRARRV